MSMQGSSPSGNPVTVVDIDIPFGRLVAIFIKWGIAAIPATIALSVIMSIVFSLLMGFFGFGAWHAGTMKM
ncbi:MAG: hypothetical protein KGM42_03775 [Hyphomicrobiales bacterium]|nr:hypothetical protein [Hyphomicrobiales bacterium]